MTAYTSLASGNWNDPTKWTPGGFPSSSADSATIAAQTVMTIPTAITIDCGAITTLAGSSGTNTELLINGQLNLHGSVSLGANTTMGGTGGLLEMNGSTVTPAGAVNYTFQGLTPSSRFIIRSTGGLGTFVDSTVAPILANMTNVAVTGQNNTCFGRSGSATAGCSYTNVSFSGCQGTIGLDNGGGANGFSLVGCDFRNQLDANPVNVGGFQPVVSLSASGSSPARAITSCTFDNSMNARPGCTSVSAANIVWSGNVQSAWLFTGVPTTSFVSNFMSNPLGLVQGSAIVLMFGGTGINDWSNLLGNYCYTQIGSGIQFGVPASDLGVTKSVTGNVFENDLSDGTGTSCQFIRFLPDAYSLLVKQNLYLGEGSPVSVSGGSFTLCDASNNTTLINNMNSTPADPSLFVARVSGAVGGTVNIYNNLIVNLTSNPTDFAVDLTNTSTGQITQLDYNVGWTAAGATTPPVLYAPSVHATGGNGPHDFATNPTFIDPTRKLSSWDAFLGGPGTASHAIASLLRLNGMGGAPLPGYTPAALVSWVRAGFVPQNNSMIGAGYNGLDIGAMPVRGTPIVASIAVTQGPSSDAICGSTYALRLAGLVNDNLNAPLTGQQPGAVLQVAASITEFLTPNYLVNAGMTAQYVAQLLDEGGAPIPLPIITTLRLSLVDTKSGAIINSLHDINILNTGRGSLTSAGLLTITLLPADTALEVGSDTLEYRSMIIVCSYGAGQVLIKQVDFGIRKPVGT